MRHDYQHILYMSSKVLFFAWASFTGGVSVERPTPNTVPVANIDDKITFVVLFINGSLLCFYWNRYLCTTKMGYYDSITILQCDYIKCKFFFNVFYYILVIFYIFKNNWYDICNLLFQNSSTYKPKTIIIEYRKI